MNIETSETPDKGWNGDIGRGASMGRASRNGDSDSKIHLRRIRLDSGGYDTGGAYWGIGGRLYEAFTDDGEFYATHRIGRLGQRNGDSTDARNAAKAEIIADKPDARFYR